MTEVDRRREQLRKSRKDKVKRQRGQITREDRQTERNRNVEKREMGKTLENMGAGSCQNIPNWKIEVWGLGITGRK